VPSFAVSKSSTPPAALIKSRLSFLVIFIFSISFSLIFLGFNFLNSSLNLIASSKVSIFLYLSAVVPIF